MRVLHNHPCEIMQHPLFFCPVFCQWHSLSLFDVFTYGWYIPAKIMRWTTLVIQRFFSEKRFYTGRQPRYPSGHLYLSLIHIWRIMFDKIIDGLAKAIMGVSSLLVFVITFLQVICRFVLKSPLPWSTDILDVYKRQIQRNLVCSSRLCWNAIRIISRECLLTGN